MFRIILVAILLCFSSVSFGSNFCANLKGVKDVDSFEKAVKVLITEQNKKFQANDDRHTIGRKLNTCTPSSHSEGLILSFAGTGAFNPRTYNIMQQLIKCDNFEGLPLWLQKNAYGLVLRNLKAKKSHYTNWSVLERGPLNRMAMNPALKAYTQKFDFAVFASEEAEILANYKDISFAKFKKIPEEVFRSTVGVPKGIMGALGCTVKYLKKAKELKISPKLVFLTHSSGGRSVVKFLEILKKLTEKKVDLVLTIDPVKEAHEAIKEVISQLPGHYAVEAVDALPFVEVEDLKVNVWTRKQPKSLYKTSNVKRWINFYQNTDEVGLKGPLKFGIRGSPIHKANANHFIKGLGESAHGEIGYEESVLDTIEQEILSLQ